MRRSHIFAVASVVILLSTAPLLAGPLGGGGPGLPGGGPGFGGAGPGLPHGGPERDLRPRTPPAPPVKKAVRKLDRAAPPGPSLGAVPTPPLPPKP